MWQAVYGPIPKGMWVLHKCDNRKCVRPLHLYLGTAAENSRDVVARGRKVPRTKLTADEVKEIRVRLAAEDETQRQIAHDFNVDPSLISRINNQEYWHPSRPWTQYKDTTTKAKS